MCIRDSLNLADVLGRIGLYGYLVRPPVALHLLAVDVSRAGPALWRTQDYHRPARAGHVAVLARVGLVGENLLDAVVERVGHRAVHRHRVVALDEVRLPAAAVEKGLKLLVRDA